MSFWTWFFSDSIWLTMNGIATFTRVLMERRGLQDCPFPRKITEVTPDWLSKVIGKEVIRVDYNSGADVAEVGAGGTGTSRAWLTLHFKDNSSQRLFVKFPATTLFERVFLSLFGVYKNELAFYKHVLATSSATRQQQGSDLQAVQVLRKLIPGVIAAETQGTDFLLVLEDVGVRGKIVKILDPYPRHRATAVLRTLAALHASHWGRAPQALWNDGTRPPFLRLVSDPTLAQVLRNFPGMLPPEVVSLYRKYLVNYKQVRRWWSGDVGGERTLVHGDAHLGNMFFCSREGGGGGEGGEGDCDRNITSQQQRQEEEECGLYDWQCAAEEHGMRDVAYHLMSSYPPDALERDEKELVREYLSFLNPQLKHPLSFEVAWFQYRVHALWVMTAFFISAGAGDLFSPEIVREICPRICRAVLRIDSAGALDILLKGS